MLYYILASCHAGDVFERVVTSKATNGKLSVIIWDPLHVNNSGNLVCPICDGTLVSTDTWTDGSSSRLNPRQLYDTHQKTLLLSRIYKCDSCKQLLLAHDSRILKMLHSPSSVPFVLMHKCGFTRSLLDLILSLVQHGMAFSSIESMITELYWNSVGKSLDEETHILETSEYQSNLGPSNDILTKCFISRFMELESAYHSAMEGNTEEIRNI